jgi:hypothetical protein
MPQTMQSAHTFIGIAIALSNVLDGSWYMALETLQVRLQFLTCGHILL